MLINTPVSSTSASSSTIVSVSAIAGASGGGGVTCSGCSVIGMISSSNTKSVMPDVHGMGARDAVFLIESRGVKVRLTGRGKVTEQSIGAGERIKKGMVCSLKLG